MEIQRQVMELYGLRKLRTDWKYVGNLARHSFLSALHRDALGMSDFALSSAHLADFRIVNSLALSILRSDDPQAPVSTQEWIFRGNKRGSDATAFDECPTSVLSQMAGFGIMFLLKVLCNLRSGEASFLLQSAIHLCLKKKGPHWLSRNLRPIIIEPALRRWGSNVMLKRMKTRGEVSDWIPPFCFSYSREIYPVFMALFVRWFIAYGVVSHAEFYCVDWDESNASAM
jgi:hypothetical protein